VLALAVGLFWAAVAVLAVHLLIAGRLLSLLWHWRRPCLPDDACPSVAVVLCLRGPDPFLRDTLRALLDQDYPAYDVHLVVDHEDDPARRTAEEVVRASGATSVILETLRERRMTCGLKCSSLIQAVSRVLDTHEVVALIDADVVPHRTWLRELVAPLADPAVGAATGNRWYMPAGPSLGSLVRHLWNVPAVGQMVCYGIPWGGSLAVRTAAVRAADLLRQWEKGLCEDVPLYSALRGCGLRVAFVPSLLMVNRETTGLGGFLRWVRRQLLLARLYHPHWGLVLLHAAAVTLVPAALLATLPAALLLGDGAAAWAGAGLGVHVAGSALVLACLEMAVRRLVRGRGEPAGWLTPRALATLPAALVALHAVYAAAVVGAVRLRTVEWRGVSYRVDGPWQVRLLGYRPYRDEARADELASL
jgi:hypothetical protein